MREQFAPLVSKAARQFLTEQVNDRLKNALGGPDAYVSVSSPAEAEPPAEAPAEAPEEPVEKAVDAETRVPIDHVSDIYRYADQLRMTVVRYDTRPARVESEVEVGGEEMGLETV